MRKLLTILTGTLIFVFLMIVGREEPLSPRNTSDIPTAPVLGSVKVNQDFGQMPLYLIPNKGQVAAQVDYYVQGKDKTIYFTSEGLTYVLNGRGARDKKEGFRDFRSKPLSMKKAENELQITTGWVVKLNFVGSNADVRPSGDEKTEAVISYFKGRPEDWKTGIPTYSRIVYRDLWPGIDLVYCGTMDRLKYEFILHPGANPSYIRLAYSGISDLKVNGEGQLEARTPVGVIEDDVPKAYQEVDGKRVDVGLRYWLEERMIEDSRVIQDCASKKPCIYGFEVGEYDRTRPLVLDPAVLVYCGYIGGAGADVGQGITVDSSGNAYVTGWTSSIEATFPVNIGPDLTYNDFWDAFVAKVNSTGNALLYCGYIGGLSEDQGSGIAIDSSGNAYITGYTYSTELDFPVIVGPDLTHNGYDDVFVAKVNSTGTTLLYCGYIGGSVFDEGLGIAVDSSGNAYVTGGTSSTELDFPVNIGPDLTYNDFWDAFVAKVNSTGTTLLYCGYIGGSDGDYGCGIAVDSSGNAYVTGYTESTETTFPVTVGPDLTQNGYEDAFVAKVNSTGTVLLYCGYIGGLSEDQGRGIAVDSSGNAYVTGYTWSTEATFPVTVGPDLTYNGGYDDAFVAKVNSTGTTLLYCGYIGGSADDFGYGIAVDSSGNAYITGYTYSTELDFPVTVGPDLTFNDGIIDAFVAKVNSTGTTLIYCGYIGGSDIDEGYGITVDSSGNAYVTGRTDCTEATFPVTVGPDLIFNGVGDVFVAKISAIYIYILTLAAGTGGTTSPAPRSYAYDIGTQVKVTAVPNSGYKFSGWSGAVTGTTNPITVTMDADKSITANFTAEEKKAEKKKGCFIATAAYGSPLHSHVEILRDFRDKYLMPNKLGRNFVDVYYKYSPFVANIIAKHKALKIAVQIHLLPLVVFCYSMVHFGPMVSALVFISIFMLPTFLISISRRKLKRTKA